MSTIKVYLHPGKKIRSSSPNFKVEYPIGFEVLVPFVEDHFEMVSDIKEADIVPVQMIYDRNESCAEDILNFAKRLRSDQLIVDIAALMHIGEGSTYRREFDTVSEVLSSLDAKDRPGYLILDHNSQTKSNHSDIMYTDFLWNRQVIFYATQPDRIFKCGPGVVRNGWYPSPDHDGNLDPSIYELSDLDHVCSASFIDLEIFNQMGNIVPKLFLSPSKTRDSARLKQYHTGFAKMIPQHQEHEASVRDFLRNELVEKLGRYPGYVGDASSGNFLIGHSTSGKHLRQFITASGPLQWFPIHNAYYDTSVLSIYVETLTHKSSSTEFVTSITEKTLEPLIKGHFILPFGYQGMIREIQEMGFQMPDWIDYSYDSIDNDLVRWHKYIDTVYSTLKMHPKRLFQKKIEDVGILKHNRELLLKGYQYTVTDALKRWLKHPDNMNHPLSEKLNLV